MNNTSNVVSPHLTLRPLPLHEGIARGHYTKTLLRSLIYWSLASRKVAKFSFVVMAVQRRILYILRTAKDAGMMASIKAENNLELCVPNNQTTRVQEVHGLIIHCLYDLINHQLFGETR